MSSPLCLVVPCKNGISLSANFHFAAGRFRQTVLLSDTKGVVLDQWEDAIDSTSDDWPSSPPIQQLSRELIQDRHTLLGVGQAGKSHWSISVEPVDTPEQQGFRFDLACRSRTRPVWLGSTYKRLIDLPTNQPQISLVCENGSPGDPDSFAIGCDWNRQLGTKYPVTFRWSYLLVVSDSLTHPSPLP